LASIIIIFYILLQRMQKYEKLEKIGEGNRFIRLTYVVFPFSLLFLFFFRIKGILYWYTVSHISISVSAVFTKTHWFEDRGQWIWGRASENWKSRSPTGFGFYLTWACKNHWGPVNSDNPLVLLASKFKKVFVKTVSAWYIYLYSWLEIGTHKLIFQALVCLD
jgi:hypothetical protein